MNRSPLATRLVGLRYLALTHRRDQFWFPFAFLGLFLVVMLIMRRPEIRFDLARIYLGFFAPLGGGVLAAYSMLGDPVLELRFVTPVRAESMLLSRLGLLLTIQALCAMTLQLTTLALGVDLSPLGSFWDVQLLWFLPTLTLAALGLSASLAGAQNALGAFAVGTVWLVQLVMKGWFEANAKPFYLFLGPLAPLDPALFTNRAVLFACALVLLGFSAALLRRPERFL